MELAAQEIRMVGNLYDLHISPVRSAARNAQPAPGKHRFVFAIELVAMPVPLADLRRAIRLRRIALRLQLARPRPQAHRSAQFVNAGQLAQLVDNAVWRSLVELARV